MIPVGAGVAYEMIHDGRPLAVLDIREAGQFGEGHALFAVPLPYSRLERRLGDLVPRRSERVLLIDQGDGVAERAAVRMADAGYDHVHVLTGGMTAWETAGLGTYKGVNVPSKLMGELAETLWHPRMLTPEELAAWQASGRPHRLFDARPAEEYARMRIPGAVCLPNGELAHRAALLPADAPVVITCAGRTRGIIGAIGLQLAGHQGPIHALENGTQGWALSGRDLEHQNDAAALPVLDGAARAASGRAAERLMRRFGLARIDAAGADAMLGDRARTTYLLDVRSHDEARSDPLPGALHAPGGQLVQATDQWLAVRHSDVILCCDTGLRAALAGFWLMQLGYRPKILSLDQARQVAVPPRASIPLPAIGSIDARSALAAMKGGAKLIDLRSSASYRAGHVAGAYWGIRPRLRQPAMRDLVRSEVLLVAETAEDAALAALDLAQAGVRVVRHVEGGQEALRRAGAAIEATAGQPPDEDCIDFLFFVHDRHSGNMDAARKYLAWETGLAGQLSAEERAEFRMIRP